MRKNRLLLNMKRHFTAAENASYNQDVLGQNISKGELPE